MSTSHARALTILKAMGGQLSTDNDSADTTYPLHGSGFPPEVVVGHGLGDKYVEVVRGSQIEMDGSTVAMRGDPVDRLTDLGPPTRVIGHTPAVDSAAPGVTYEYSAYNLRVWPGKDRLFSRCRIRGFFVHSRS